MDDHMNIVLGIDFGGTGIKGALVDVEKGVLLTERYRIPTPDPAHPDSVAGVVAEVVKHFEWHKPAGCTFPGIIKDGIAYSAANIDPLWIGVNGETLLSQATGCRMVMLNDADAAGLAEMYAGAGKGQKGVVIVLTIGTGIGSAVFIQGNLLPNTELGHLEIRGKEAEHRASDRVRKEKDMTWEKWAKKFNEYLTHLEYLFSPDLIILGGGASKKHENYLHLFETRAHIVPAQLLNNAGIVGAAMAASRRSTAWQQNGVLADATGTPR